MPEHPDTWAWLAAWLEQHWPTLYAGLLALIIAALRIMYGGGTLRRIAIEAPLCGALAMAASHGLPLLGVSASTAPFFGGIIGLLGVEGTRAAARKFFIRKEASL